jgi:hypothetical protein
MPAVYAFAQRKMRSRQTGIGGYRRLVSLDCHLSRPWITSLSASTCSPRAEFGCASRICSKHQADNI